MTCELLHHSGYSKVFLGSMPDGMLSAYKVYSTRHLAARHWLNISRECAILSKLHDAGVHGVVQLISVADTPHHFSLQFKPCLGGNLYQAIERRECTDEASLCVKVIVPLLRVLSELHARGIIHRDVKPENIFFEADGSLVLGDFGLAIDTTKHTPRSRVGTTDYMAPEVLAQPSADAMVLRNIQRSMLRPYDAAVDVWALGVLVHEALTGVTPFTHAEPAVMSLKAQFGPAARLPSHVSPECQAFVDAVLAKAGPKRPTAAALLRHPWVAKHAPAAAAAAAAATEADASGGCLKVRPSEAGIAVNVSCGVSSCPLPAISPGSQGPPAAAQAGAALSASVCGGQLAPAAAGFGCPRAQPQPQIGSVFLGSSSGATSAAMAAGSSSAPGEPSTPAPRLQLVPALSDPVLLEVEAQVAPAPEVPSKAGGDAAGALQPASCNSPRSQQRRPAAAVAAAQPAACASGAHSLRGQSWSPGHAPSLAAAAGRATAVTALQPQASCVGAPAAAAVAAAAAAAKLLRLPPLDAAPPPAGAAAGGGSCPASRATSLFSPPRPTALVRRLRGLASPREGATREGAPASWRRHCSLDLVVAGPATEGVAAGTAACVAPPSHTGGAAAASPRGGAGKAASPRLPRRRPAQHGAQPGLSLGEALVAAVHGAAHGSHAAEEVHSPASPSPRRAVKGVCKKMLQGMFRQSVSQQA